MDTVQQEMTDDFVTVESIFVRQRNCHLLKAQLSPIFTDYYLHLMQHGLRNEDPVDSLLKNLTAYFTLHLVSRPWAEYHAWTINLRSPLVANLFVSGSSLTESVVARAFTEDVRVPDQNTLFTQMIRDGKNPQTSVILLHGDTPETWVEDYYRQSEQRIVRCFELPDENFILITAQPDADLDWLQNLTLEDAASIEKNEETKVMETRRLRFHCGCTIDKILPTVRTMKKDFADLLSEQGKLDITCPRCAAQYVVTADMLQDGPDEREEE